MLKLGFNARVGQVYTGWGHTVDSWGPLQLVKLRVDASRLAKEQELQQL